MADGRRGVSCATWAAATTVLCALACTTAAARPDKASPYFVPTRRTSVPSFGRLMLAEFNMDPEYRNFNFGSYGTVPQTVWEPFQRYQQQMEARPDIWFRNDYRVLIDGVRERLASYLGANASDLVLVENASAAINGVYRSFRFQPGEKLVVFSSDYPVQKNVLEWLAFQDGVEVLTLNVTFPVVSDEVTFLAPLRALFDAHPTVRMVIFSHVGSMPGIIQPAQAIASLCKSYGATVVVDGAHAPGQIDVDIPSIGADFYLGNNHKWLYAPKGSGFLWVDPRFHEATIPTIISGEFKGADYVRRFLYTGTRDYTPMIATLNALEFREQLGDAAIKAYMTDLAWWAGSYLSNLWNTSTIAPRAYVGSMVDVLLPLGTLAEATALKDWLYATYDTFIILHEQNGRPYVRLSAQIFLEQADFVELGARTVEFLDKRRAA